MVKLACTDCGLLYSDPGWCDTHIPDEIWLAINNNDAGVLCITCIARRLVKSNINNVSLMITSGPFRNEAAESFQKGYEHALKVIEDNDRSNS